jgi:2-methylcitrate dehydratase PrpD
MKAAMTPTESVARHIAAAAAMPLPSAVADKTALHVLDTLAAIVSGAPLAAGRAGAALAATLGGPPEALVVASGERAGAMTAALANAMAAHADETDDSHVGGRFHPGCAVVPAALAVAERDGRSGAELLRAVALGYDIGARAVMALGFRSAKNPPFSTHTIGGHFGAGAAAAAMAGLSATQAEAALSYLVQQAGGVPYWRRDSDHIEKAFDFGGAGARNGVMAAQMVEAGWTGVRDTLTGDVSYLSAFAEEARPAALTEGLGERFEIMEAAIKKWCVGSPIQAALDSLTAIMAEHRIGADDVARLTATMPDDRLHIVDDRDMPDVCLQHLLAVTLLDGGLSFAAAHDKARMDDAAVRALRARIVAEPSAELTAARPPRQAIITIETRDGRTLRHHTRAVLGTPANPMSADQVANKARDLLMPHLGASGAERLIAAVLDLESMADVRSLTGMLRFGG